MPPMLFCTRCGARNEGGVKFCTACGERLEAPAAQSVLPTALPETVTSLSTGDRVVGAGGVFAIISFFLPWASGRSPWSGQSDFITGVGIASQATGWVVLEPLIAATAVALVFLARQSSRQAKIQVAGWQILLGTIYAFLGLAGLFVASQVTGALGLGGSVGLSVGWWGFTVGHLAIIVGAFVSLRDLTVGL